MSGRPLVKSAYQKYIFSYFSTKTYVVGSQKNHLNETVLLSTHNIDMLKLMRKKIFTILRSKILLIGERYRTVHGPLLQYT